MRRFIIVSIAASTLALAWFKPELKDIPKAVVPVAIHQLAKDEHKKEHEQPIR
jgi:hypothetical protein